METVSEHISRDIFEVYYATRSIFGLLGVWKMSETRLIIHQVHIKEIITITVLGYPNSILRLISPL